MSINKEYRKVFSFSSNTLIVTLPIKMCALLGIQRGDTVKITTADKSIIIEKVE